MSERQRLIDLRKLFEDMEDWVEVSKIQYQIEQLPPPPKPEPKLETWFILALIKHQGKILERIVNEDRI